MQSIRNLPAGSNSVKRGSGFCVSRTALEGGGQDRAQQGGDGSAIPRIANNRPFLNGKPSFSRGNSPFSLHFQPKIRKTTLHLLHLLVAIGRLQKEHEAWAPIMIAAGDIVKSEDLAAGANEG